MVIDEGAVRGGITADLVGRLIAKHENKAARYRYLYGYYLGKHAIGNRVRAADGLANNKITANHAKYITDMIQSYLTGNPVTYAASEEFDIEPLKNAYLEQDIASVDSELIKNMSIYGRAYELIYANENAKPGSVILKPENTFVCYAQTAEEKPLFGVYYYRRYSLDGRCRGVVCRVYDSTQIYTFTSRGDTFESMTLQSEEPHYFGGVPVIEYRNNTEKQGDFEQVISLIDAYNVLMSDRVNDKEQFVDTFLFLKNIEVDTEQARKLKREKILMSMDPDADARYLSKVMNESDIKVLRDDIKNDIHRLSHVPDLSDESFGNNLSGVAIKYKLLGFEQHIKNKERLFSKALRERFKLYNTFLTTLHAMKEVPTHRVDVLFTYNLPANELEIAKMVQMLNGIVSTETLLDQLPFVTDAGEELNIAKKEKQEDYESKQLSRLKEYREAAEGGEW